MLFDMYQGFSIEKFEMEYFASNVTWEYQYDNPAFLSLSFWSRELIPR